MRRVYLPTTCPSHVISLDYLAPRLHESINSTYYIHPASFPFQRPYDRLLTIHLDLTSEADPLATRIPALLQHHRHPLPHPSLTHRNTSRSSHRKTSRSLLIIADAHPCRTERHRFVHECMRGWTIAKLADRARKL
jgi:hypothetical protein